MSAELRVLLLINNLEPAGAEKVVVNLAKTIDRRRFRVSVGTVWPGGELESAVRAAGIRLFHLCKPGDNPIRAVPALRRLLRRERIAVLHAQLGVAGLVARLTALTVRSVGTVYTEQNVASGYSRFGRLLNCATLGLPDVVVGSSDGVLESWKRCRSKSSRLTAVIPNGIDIPPSRGSVEIRRRWRGVFDASDNDIVIGTIGYCYERKGQRFLIEACERLLRDRPVRLVIVGDGPLRSELEQMTRSAGVEARVTFTGAQPDIAGLISSFDIFALPSLAEGMPIALLEAMARGLPTVATAVGANSHVIRDGESGLLVPPRAISELHRALDLLVASQSLRERLGTAARQRIIDEFSVERMSREYEQLYERLAAGARLRSS
jgi:glycosyltransferase involved in cell wall biosynthesis